MCVCVCVCVCVYVCVHLVCVVCVFCLFASWAQVPSAIFLRNRPLSNLTTGKEWIKAWLLERSDQRVGKTESKQGAIGSGRSDAAEDRPTVE